MSKNILPQIICVQSRVSVKTPTVDLVGHDFVEEALVHAPSMERPLLLIAAILLPQRQPVFQVNGSGDELLDEQDVTVGESFKIGEIFSYLVIVGIEEMIEHQDGSGLVMVGSCPGVAFLEKKFPQVGIWTVP